MKERKYTYSITLTLKESKLADDRATAVFSLKRGKPQRSRYIAYAISKEAAIASGKQETK